MALGHTQKVQRIKPTGGRAGIRAMLVEALDNLDAMDPKDDDIPTKAVILFLNDDSPKNQPDNPRYDLHFRNAGFKSSELLALCDVFKVDILTQMRVINQT
jgi:hypothetical protein